MHALAALTLEKEFGQMEGGQMLELLAWPSCDVARSQSLTRRHAHTGASRLGLG